MKIIIHSLDELLALSELVAFGKVPREVHDANTVVQLQPDPVQEAKLLGLLAEHRAPRDPGVVIAGNGVGDPEAPAPSVGYTVSDRTYDEVQKDTEAAHVALVDVAFDADGAPYSTDWHSVPAKLTAKDLWRARRGRDEDAYKAWLLEQAVEVAELAIAADEAGPVATETPALPKHSTDAALDVALSEDAAKLVALGADPGPTLTDLEAPQAPGVHVDLEVLIAASQEAALDASDSHVDLLNACRDFTSKHGHPAFTALKAAVAPDGDSGQGKTVQHLTPGERRLMQACIANYPSN